MKLVQLHLIDENKPGELEAAAYVYVNPEKVIACFPFNPRCRIVKLEDNECWVRAQPDFLYHVKGNAFRISQILADKIKTTVP